MVKKMKNTTRLTAIMTTAILISLMATSLTSSAFINNINPEAGTVSTNNTYMSSSNTAYGASAKYGELVNPDYEWRQFIGGGLGNTGFNKGPAPDRFDILWSSQDMANFGTPNGAHLVFDGKMFMTVTRQLGNGSNRPFMAALNPFTGATLWNTSLPQDRLATPTLSSTSFTWSFTAAFGGTCMYQVDDNHLAALTSGGLTMFRSTDGALLWNDTDINPGAVYHNSLYDPDLMMIFGPESVGNENAQGYRYYMDFGWDLSNPEVNKGQTNGVSNRQVWSRVRHAAGNPQLCLGNGKVFEGSYQSAVVYALDAKTGALLWETRRPDAAGYAGTYSAEFDILVTGCQSQWVIAYN